jgi:hypothetical protein
VRIENTFLAAMFLGSLAGCQKMPETYAPPEQRQPIENFRPYRISRVVDMADGDADSHIVSDIATGGGGPWRWTGSNPTVKLLARTAENLYYVIDLSIADTTLKTTGPVTITFNVGGRNLDSARYESPGTFHFEKAVPEGWVEAGKEVNVGATIDKVWTSPQDGAKLGFILIRMGLRQGPGK